MIHKLQKIRSWGCIAPNNVVSLTTYFSVSKGKDNIQMVFKGTVSGLNASTWVPSFWLPTIRTHMHMTVPGSVMGDLDVGEMFHNFILFKAMRKYCSVDLSLYFPEELLKEGGRLWEAWCRDQVWVSSGAPTRRSKE
jgi:hypothetical protein